MKNKTTIFAIAAVLVLLAVLLVPVPAGTLDDGGTRVYSAVSYKIVVWNKLIVETNPDGSNSKEGRYHKTSVYWFPENLKSIDALWQNER